MRSLLTFKRTGKTSCGHDSSVFLARSGVGWDVDVHLHLRQEVDATYWAVIIFRKQSFHA